MGWFRSFFCARALQPPRRRITESEAVKMVTEHLATAAIEAWPKLRSSFQDFAPVQLPAIDEEQASLDLLLAATALDMQAIPNLFPADQAERLIELTFLFGRSLRHDDYGVHELMAYIDLYQDELARSQNNPLEAIEAVCWRLLRRWYGNKPDVLQVDLDEYGLGNQKNAFFADYVVEALMNPSFVGTWKTLNGTFIIAQRLR